MKRRVPLRFPEEVVKVSQSIVRNTVAALGVGAALLASYVKAGAATDPCTLLAASEAQRWRSALYRHGVKGPGHCHGVSPGND